MLEKQIELANYLDYLIEKLEMLDLSYDVFESLGLKEMKNKILSTELLIPVIGAFSSGKSSLINSLLGQEILPVGITPETSLATEIRYSTDERIEAIIKNDDYDKYSINEMPKISENAQKYKYLRIYLNNNKVEKLLPLILVDMPGFESPLDIHNKAILEYINKGVYFVVLHSVEQGTLSASTIRKLEEIKEYKREFSFFLSKTNLRSEKDVLAVKKELQELIKSFLGIEMEITCVNDNGGEALVIILNKINPEKLFSSLFIESLKKIFYDIVSTINTFIESYKSSKEENELAIKDLQTGLESIIHKRESMINEVKNRYSENNTDKIIEEIGRMLSLSVDELANAAVKNGRSALESKLSEIIQHTLITNVNSTIKDISDNIINDFSSVLSDMDISTSKLGVSDEFISRISDIAKTMLGLTQKFLENDRKEKYSNKAFYKVITTVLSVTTSIVSPLVELIIIFLPEILGGVFETMYKQKQIDKIKTDLLSTIIPQIKMKLREKLPEILNKQITDMISQISNLFENEINKKKDEISLAQKEKKEKISEIEEKIELYDSILSEIKKTTNNVLFKE